MTTEELIKAIENRTNVQQDIIGLYTDAIFSQFVYSQSFDWSAINHAIITRWSRSGLNHIKIAAWKESGIRL